MSDEKNVFDLSNLDVVKSSGMGFELELLHPISGEKLPMSLTVLGKDSEEFQEATLEQQRARILSASRKKKMEMPDMNEVKRTTIILLASVTVAMKGFVENGKPISYSREAVIDLYTRFPWILEQVDAAVNDRANFLKG